MKWEDYRKIFLNYQQTVSETRLISLVTAQILKDFPNNIPKNIMTPAYQTMDKFAEVIQNIVLSKGESDTDKTKRPSKVKRKKNAQLNLPAKAIDAPDQFANEILLVMIAYVGRKEAFRFEDLNFERLQSFQALVMHFSNFEGILADSLRAICRVHPEVMRKKKTVEWEEILSLKSWQELIDMITEKFVRELGWQSLEARIDTFRTLFGLEISLTKEDISVLRTVELMRNLIVHNAGKIDLNYIKLEPTKNLKIGDAVPIDDAYLYHASHTLQVIASEIYLQVSMKYFGKKRSEAITCVAWREPSDEKRLKRQN